MVLRGDITIDKDTFVVLNADPGMENSDTYKYVSMMWEECDKAGIYHETAEGPNLYTDLVQLGSTDCTRFDNPPYWTKDEKGKRGKLIQKCTAQYKIAPMDRAIRRILEDRYAISHKSKRIGEKIVEKWIGFAADERHRIKVPTQKYMHFRYPLVEMKLKTEGVVKYFIDNKLPTPPRSVCNACFANRIEYFKEMYENRPEDWNQAVAVDNAVRDWSQIGINDTVFVSAALVPLEELARSNFQLPNGEDDEHCQTGYCFT